MTQIKLSADDNFHLRLGYELWQIEVMEYFFFLNSFHVYTYSHCTLYSRKAAQKMVKEVKKQRTQRGKLILKLF